MKKYEYVTIPEEVKIPEHIIDATFINPPIEVIELVGLISSKSFVCFYEHLKIEQSYRYDLNIFINARLTYWRNYIVEPYAAKSYGEVLTLRLLHELGHLVNEHTGSIQIFNGKAQTITSKENEERCENEAWQWAFNYRRENAESYINIVKKCQEFADTYPYTNVTW